MKKMFAHPFSFSGRIRRMEYGISFIIYVIVSAFANIKSVTPDSSVGISLLIMAVNILLLWFFLAQGAKRCHDRGNSGWYQLIPFYPLWLLFGDGDDYDNAYGPDPKGRDSSVEVGQEVES